MKRKQLNSIDSQLYNIFRDYYSTDEDCDKAVKEAKKAFFTAVKNDRLFRKEEL